MKGEPRSTWTREVALGGSAAAFSGAASGLFFLLTADKAGAWATFILCMLGFLWGVMENRWERDE